jgi:hypothetical protein
MAIEKWRFGKVIRVLRAGPALAGDSFEGAEKDRVFSASRGDNGGVDFMHGFVAA